ncbi:MAG TPA: hypothetical protein VFZ63_07615 [Jiangellaceae bacterium]
MTMPERDYEPVTDVETQRLNDTGGGPTLVEDSGDLYDRWQRAQAGFVDSPREAVQEAGAIVEDVLGRLRESFGGERSRLEAAWESGGEPSTEDLRLAIQRYRTFFERLLAA